MTNVYIRERLLRLQRIALGYLYSSVSLSLIRPENARAALAAGCLLGRMEDLCNYAYEVCRQSITVDNISNWLEFVDSMPPASDGTSTPVDPHHNSQTRTAIFGHYAHRLRDDVFNFLVVTLPNTLNVGALASPASPHPDGAQSDAGRDTLLQVFARVPFDLFKTAVESPIFQIGTRILYIGKYHVLVDSQGLIYLLDRFRPGTVQICQRRHRVEKAGNRAWAERRNGRACVWQLKLWRERSARHAQDAQEAVVEGQLLSGERGWTLLLLKFASSYSSVH